MDNALNIVSDPRTIITFLSLLVAIVSLVLSYRRHERKSFSYEVLTSYELFSVQDDIKSRVQILLDGKPVQDVVFGVIRLTNTGNKPISVDDYQVPVSLHFGDES